MSASGIVGLCVYVRGCEPGLNISLRMCALWSIDVYLIRRSRVTAEGSLTHIEERFCFSFINYETVRDRRNRGTKGSMNVIVTLILLLHLPPPRQTSHVGGRV